MNEADCLSHLISPGTLRIDKSYMQGVIQILVTSSCDQNCYNCTQLSQLRRKPEFMSPEQFEQAVLSLKGYFGVYGTFGGNPCLSPHFKDYCEILKKHVPFQQRGLWSNNPIKLENAKAARDCYNPAYSNINVHLNQHAFDMWKQGWPECRPIGLSQDSRHSPCFTAMKDLDNLPVFNEQHQKIGVMENTEENRHTLISDCDIAKNWSAAIGMFRGQLRGFFCEIALAQAIHHQDAPDYSDTGLDVTMTYHAEGRSDRCLWWQLPMQAFAPQVRTACHSCGVPLRGHGENAMANSGKEQVSRTHATNYEPKRKGRTVELVTELVQLGVPLVSTTNYLGNSGRP